MLANAITLPSDRCLNLRWPPQNLLLGTLHCTRSDTFASSGPDYKTACSNEASWRQLSRPHEGVWGGELRSYSTNEISRRIAVNTHEHSSTVVLGHRTSVTMAAQYVNAHCVLETFNLSGDVKMPSVNSLCNIDYSGQSGVLQVYCCNLECVRRRY